MKHLFTLIVALTAALCTVNAQKRPAPFSLQQSRCIAQSEAAATATEASKVVRFFDFQTRLGRHVYFLDRSITLSLPVTNDGEAFSSALTCKVSGMGVTKSFTTETLTLPPAEERQVEDGYTYAVRMNLKLDLGALGFTEAGTYTVEMYYGDLLLDAADIRVLASYDEMAEPYVKACTAADVIEANPYEGVDYSVTLHNPNDVDITGGFDRLGSGFWLEVTDLEGNHKGSVQNEEQMEMILPAGQDVTMDSKLYAPASGETRRYYLRLGTDYGTYTFGYFDLKGKEVTEGTPVLSATLVEPQPLRVGMGDKITAKVEIKNDGGFFTNSQSSSMPRKLKYAIWSKKLSAGGKNFENIPIFESDVVAQTLCLDKGETGIVEIELGTEVFAGKELYPILKLNVPDYRIEPGDYNISFFMDGTSEYTDPIPFRYDLENKLYAPAAPVRAKAGTQVTLPINMKNGNDICAFQFDVYFPEGVTYAKNADGQALVTLGDRTDVQFHSLSPNPQTDGALRVLCFSGKNFLFDGNEGDVLSLKLDIAADASEGLKELLIKNIALTDPQGNVYLPNDFAAPIDVYHFIPGDANGDGTVNVADIPAIASIILGTAGTNFSADAADVNADGIVRVDDISTLVASLMNGGAARQTAALSRAKAAARAPEKVYPDLTEHSEGAGEIIPFSIEPGQSTTLTFDMDVPEVDLCGFQFDLYLPDGLTIDKNARGIYNVGFVADRADYSTHTLNCQDFVSEADGLFCIRFICFSLNNVEITGRSGAVVTIPVTASADFAPGVHEVQLKNIITTTSAAVAWGLPENRLTVVSGNLSATESLPALQGHWTAAAAMALNDKLALNNVLTAIDLTEVTAIDAGVTFRAGNPNTLVYADETRPVPKATNVVIGDRCAQLIVKDGYPFHAPVPFTATAAEYSRTLAAAGWYSLCLPFAADIPDGISVERFRSLDETALTVSFDAADAIVADVPCIFRANKSGEVRFSAAEAAVVATPALLADGALTATYRRMAAGTLTGKYALRNDGTGFGICDETAYAPAFRAYLDGGTSLSSPALALLHGTLPTGIGRIEAGGLDILPGRGQAVVRGAADCDVDILAVSGQKVCSLQLKAGVARTVVLPAGVYIAAGRKFIVR